MYRIPIYQFIREPYIDFEKKCCCQGKCWYLALLDINLVLVDDVMILMLIYSLRQKKQKNNLGDQVYNPCRQVLLYKANKTSIFQATIKLKKDELGIHRGLLQGILSQSERDIFYRKVRFCNVFVGVTNIKLFSGGTREAGTI